MRKAIICFFFALSFCVANGQDRIGVTQKSGSEKSSASWLIGIQAGGSLLLTPTADVKNTMTNMGIPNTKIDDYIRQYKNGFSLSGDLHYLLKRSFGLGVNYSFFTSSSKLDFTLPIPAATGYIFNFNFDEKLYVNYVGPSVIFQQSLNKNSRFQLSEAASLGYVNYRDELRTRNSATLPDALAKSHSWGGTIDLSCEYFLIPWLSVGVNAGIMYVLPIKEENISTTIGSATVKLEENQYEKLSRFDYSISARFHF